MTGIMSGKRIDSVIEAEPTGARRLREWQNESSADGEQVSPALDIAALERQFGTERANDPQLRRMSFRIPAEWLKAEGGIKSQFWGFYETRRKEALGRWFGMLDSEGFDPFFGRLPNKRQARLKLSPGYYPAIDTLTGAALLGEAEVTASCWIVPRKAQLTRFELTPDLVSDTRPALMH